MQIVLYIISALFALKLLVNLFRLVFVNFAKRRELNQSLTLLATKENGLDYLLQTVNCALLVNDAPWSTLELLVCPATLTGGKKLSVTSKAILLDAFQKRGLHYSSRTARTVEDLILSVHGSDCTTLKNMTDLGGDYQVSSKRPNQSTFSVFAPLFFTHVNNNSNPAPPLAPTRTFTSSFTPT